MYGGDGKNTFWLGPFFRLIVIGGVKLEKTGGVGESMTSDRWIKVRIVWLADEWIK